MATVAGMADSAVAVKEIRVLERVAPPQFGWVEPPYEYVEEADSSLLAADEATFIVTARLAFACKTDNATILYSAGK